MAGFLHHRGGKLGQVNRVVLKARSPLLAGLAIKEVLISDLCFLLRLVTVRASLFRPPMATGRGLAVSTGMSQLSVPSSAQSKKQNSGEDLRDEGVADLRQILG